MRKKFLCPVIILLVFFTGNAFGIEILGIHFAPDKEVYKPIVALYDVAERTLHLAIYSLTKDEFTEALVRAFKRGVEVKVLIDKGQANDANAKDEMLESAGIALRRSKGNGSMHNKFCVVDGIIVYTGSFNHTNSATVRNDENYIIIKDKDIAETFEKQFQKIWGKHK